MKIDIEEFESLANQDIRESEFYDQILSRMVVSVGANAGVLWDCSDGPYRALCQHTQGEATPIRISEQDHEKILTNVMGQQRSAIVRPNQNGSESGAPFILLAPVNGAKKGLIELIVPPQGQTESDQQLLTYVDRICSIVADRKPGGSASETNPTSARQIPLEQFSQFVHSLHKTIDRRLASANIVNETRRLLDCDRVSLMLWHRGTFKIFAISGQPSVNRRSNSVQLLERFSKKILKMDKTFWYPDESELPPQLKRSLDEYLSISVTRSLVVHPIRQRVPDLVEDPESNERKHNPVIGGIIYEHCNEQWDQASISPTLNLTTHHVGDALRNSKRHHDLFLYPLWNLLGKSRILAAPRILPKTLMVLGAITSAVLVLTFWKVPFYVSANGILVPQERKWVFSNTTGEVADVDVEHGINVRKGDSLITLENPELRIRIEDAVGRIETLEQRKAAIESRKFENSVSGVGSTDEDNLDSLQSEIDSLKTQLVLMSKMASKLDVQSPMDGQVITWDVRQKLEGRTVQPQQLLIEIADPEGPWQLELDVEDRRVGHLLRGMEQSEEHELAVKFTLAADPNRTYNGKIVEVSNAMWLNADNEQMIRVRVEIDEDALALKQAKSGVSAKIYCGYETSIGYLWLHDIPESFRRYVMFYFAR